MSEDEQTIPVEAAQALHVLRNCLGETVVAAWLHGSAVAGGLRQGSDVDVLAVVDRPIALTARQRLASELLLVSGRHPARAGFSRPIELIVFLRSDLAEFQHPVRGEFVYGEWLREAFEAGELPEPGFDPEFTLLLAQARPDARALFGPEAAELLPEISRDEIVQAIGDALPTLLSGLDGDELIVLLTLARMWQTLETGQFVPKDVAARWAAARLPAGPASALSAARGAYHGINSDDWQVPRGHVRQAAIVLSERVKALL